MSATSIAILMACHNRRQKTLACLQSLAEQEDVDDVATHVYLVDDASTDGTGVAIREQFPDVTVLEGDGQLFWCGGMRWAFEEAMKEDHTYYLWLNDDTLLRPTALALLLDAYKGLPHNGACGNIMVGSLADPTSGKLTYGGVIRGSRWHPFHYRLVQPGPIPRPCETMNGNCVMICRTAARAVGNMDARFVHGFGDFDYGLRALRRGCSVWVAPGFVGTCRRNPERLRWRDANVPRRERWAFLMSHKGLPPRQMLLYSRRHGGPLWPVFWSVPYLRALFFPVKKVGEPLAPPRAGA